MNVELNRYRVRPGKSAQVDEWMRVLNDRKAECLATLDRERMFVEVIFRERAGGDDFLYWFTLQGEDGSPVETSPHDIDRTHLDFWAECIDSDYRPQDCSPQLVLMQAGIAKAMGWEEG
jgi:hypothetical protein